MKYLVCFMLMLPFSQKIHAQSALNLSGITDKVSMEQFYKEQKKKSEPSSFGETSYVSIDDGVWNGIKVKSITLYQDHIEMSVNESSNFETKKLIDYLQAQYKGAITKETEYSYTNYAVNNSDVKIAVRVKVKEEEAVTKNTSSTIEINYKTKYKLPFPNIDQEIKQDPDGLFYYFDFSSLNTSTEIRINGISVYEHSGKFQYVNGEQFNLNPFILNKGQAHLQIIIKPGYDEAGKQMNTIIKNSYFKGKLCEGKIENGEWKCLKEYPFCDYMEYVTDTTKENGRTQYSSYPGTYHYGGKSLQCELNFDARVSYNLEGWKHGKDLKSDSKLKERITALYEKLATAIKNKDEQAFNDLVYTQGVEKAAARYNMFSGYSTDKWEEWLKMFSYGNTFKIETDFDLSFSDDGKLVIATPNKQSDMLRVIGMKQAEGFTFYIYEDNTTNQLKFIR